MGKKKGNTNETDVAETGAVALEQAVSQEHDEPAAAALVDGDCGATVDPPASEHPTEPAAATEQPEAGEHDAEPQDEAPADAADVVETPSSEESNGVTDESGTTTGDGDDACSEDLADNEGAASVDELGGERGPADGADLGDAVAVVVDGDDGSGAGEAEHDDDADAGRTHDGATTSSSPLLGDVDRRALLETPPINGPGKVSDGITLVAHIAGSLAAWLQNATSGEPMPEVGMLSLEMGEQLYAFTDKIRERATPDVLASQLVILKYREHQDLNLIQRVTLEVFASLSLIMLKQEDDIAERMRAALETKPDPRPIPIDETTMETTDDPLATWER